MERLIDANEVKKYIHDLMLNNADRYTDKEMAQYDNLIDSCQTVEAIPKKWIKKWLGDCQLYDDSVCAMLKDWEEENE